MRRGAARAPAAPPRRVASPTTRRRPRLRSARSRPSATTTPTAVTGRRRRRSPTPRARRGRASSCGSPSARWPRRAAQPPDHPERASATPGTITSSAASPPGHDAPAPSAPQNIPNDVSITPTKNFIVFSGTRASGARTATPAEHDDRDRDGRGRGGEADVVLARPEREHDERDLEPFEQHALERDRERVAVEPRGRRGLARAASVSRRTPRPRRGRALRPAERSTALRSHCSPKTSSSPPTTTRSTLIGSAVSAGPSAATITARTSGAGARRR